MIICSVCGAGKLDITEQVRGEDALGEVYLHPPHRDYVIAEAWRCPTCDRLELQYRPKERGE